MSATCQHPFRLRRCRVPAGADFTSLSPVQFVHRAPHRSRAARTQYHMRSPPRARPRRAAGSARTPTETARGATTSRNRRPARAPSSRAPDGQHPRPARAPPGGGTVWRAPRARRTLLTVLNLFIARPRVRRSRPGRPPHVNAARRRPAVPPRHRPSPTAHRGAPPTPVVRGARLAPVARGAAARRSAGDVYRGRVCIRGFVVGRAGVARQNRWPFPIGIARELPLVPRGEPGGGGLVRERPCRASGAARWRAAHQSHPESARVRRTRRVA